MADLPMIRLAILVLRTGKGGNKNGNVEVIRQFPDSSLDTC